MKRYAVVFAAIVAAGCAGKLPGAKPDSVRITLAPDVVSSQDGTLHISAMVLEGNTALENFKVTLSIDYVDRNQVPRAIAGTSGLSGLTGTLDYLATGLRWEGIGTVTAKVAGPDGTPVLDKNGQQVSSTATFSVLDLTPPTVTILPPTSDLKVGPGLPFDVEVNVGDEIGVSQVTVQVVGEVVAQDTQLIASGTTNGRASFSYDIPLGALPGPTITVYALAADMSGNLAAASATVLTVDPAVTIATLQGFTATKIAEGSNTFLNAPRAIALSPKDGQLYIADNSAGAPCNGRCIRKVDPATGAPAAAAVVNGVGQITGVSFDATGDHLYYSDTGAGGQQGQLIQLTYAAMTGYGTPVTCNIPANQLPQTPLHSVFDGTLGLLVADSTGQALRRQATCTGVDPTTFTNGGGNFNNPIGVAQAPGGNDFYVSDPQGNNQSIIWHVNAAGATDVFQDFNNNSAGIEWMSGGTSAYDNTLFVTTGADRRVISTNGTNRPKAVVFFRDSPVDLTGSVGTAWIITLPGNNDPGRLYKVTGF